MTEIEASKNHQRKSSSFEGRHRQAGLHHYKSLVSLTLRKCYFEDEGMLGLKSLVCWVSMRDIIQSLTWKCWWEGKPPLSLKSCYFHYFSLDNWGIIGGDNLQVDVDCRFPTFRSWRSWDFIYHDHRGDRLRRLRPQGTKGPYIRSQNGSCLLIFKYHLDHYITIVYHILCVIYHILPSIQMGFDHLDGCPVDGWDIGHRSWCKASQERKDWARYRFGRRMVEVLKCFCDWSVYPLVN